MAKPRPSPHAYLRALAKELREAAPHALRRWDADAIHHARVSTRRLKAAIDCFEPLLPGALRKPFSKSLRRLRKRFGPLRDLDVMLEHLRELSSEAGNSEAAEWLKDRLHDERRAVRKEIRSEKPRLLRGAAGSGGRRLWVAVKKAKERTPAMAAGCALEQFADFVSRANRLAAVHGEGRRTPAQADRHAPSADQPDVSADDAHAVRKAGKQVRYTLEIAGACGLGVPDDCAESFKAIQDLLGLWHDWAVLTQHVICLAGEKGLAVSEPKLFDQILVMAGVAWKRAQQRLDEFISVWAERGPQLAETIPLALAYAQEPLVCTSDSPRAPRAPRRRRAGRRAKNRPRMMNGQLHPASAT